MALIPPPTSLIKAAEAVILRGTAFVGDPVTDALDPNRTPPADAPQFTSPRLDAALLAECFHILTGPPALDRSRHRHAQEHKVGVRRVPLPGSLNLRRSVAVVLCVCSEEFCRELAALNDERAAQIAEDWYRLLHPNVPASHLPDLPEHRAQHRASILRELASLARAAIAQNKQLLLRVEFRMQLQRAPEPG
jgi:hypothetical protein